MSVSECVKMEECVCALDETLLIDFNKLIDDCYARDEECVNGGGAENNVDFFVWGVLLHVYRKQKLSSS